jgi:hypothetical protein
MEYGRLQVWTTRELLQGEEEVGAEKANTKILDHGWQWQEVGDVNWINGAGDKPWL